LIATEESGDAVVDGETGRVIPANDVEALAAALEWAAGNRDALAEMGRRGRERVERCLTWDHYRLRLLNGYAKVMGGGA
jgi:glycosyltransferase involved in cell wall biosynthesis